MPPLVAVVVAASVRETEASEATFSTATPSASTLGWGIAEEEDLSSGNSQAFPLVSGTVVRIVVVAVVVVPAALAAAVVATKVAVVGAQLPKLPYSSVWPWRAAAKLYDAWEW